MTASWSSWYGSEWLRAWYWYFYYSRNKWTKWNFCAQWNAWQSICLTIQFHYSFHFDFNFKANNQRNCWSFADHLLGSNPIDWSQTTTTEIGDRQIEERWLREFITPTQVLKTMDGTLVLVVRGIWWRCSEIGGRFKLSFEMDQIICNSAQQHKRVTIVSRKPNKWLGDCLPGSHSNSSTTVLANCCGKVSFEDVLFK